MNPVPEINLAAIEIAIGTVLKYVDEDSGREGLWRTPERVAEMYRELFAGVGKDPADEIDAVFTEENAYSPQLRRGMPTRVASSHDMPNPVVVRDIPFYSMCEHHMLPFFGTASLVYIPHLHIAGISKIARALDVAARRLQVQERLTHQLADAVYRRVQPWAVGCRLEAEHLCMSMRGIQKPGHKVITMATRGAGQSGVDLPTGIHPADLHRLLTD